MENGINPTTGEMADPTACGPALAALVEKVLAASKEMKKLEKAGRMMDRYSYITLEDIISEVRPALLRHGVILYRRDCRIHSYEMRETADKRIGTYVTVDADFVLTDGLAEIRLSGSAESRDTGDKAMQKAQSAALKYVLIQSFLLQHDTDQDDYSGEIHSGQPEAQPRPPRQATTTQRPAAPRQVPAGGDKAAEALQNLQKTNAPVKAAPVASVRQPTPTPAPPPPAAPAAPQAAATPIPAAWGGDGGPVSEKQAAIMKVWVESRVDKNGTKQSLDAVIKWAQKDAKNPNIKGLADFSQSLYRRVGQIFGYKETAPDEWVYTRAK